MTELKRESGWTGIYVSMRTNMKKFKHLIVLVVIMIIVLIGDYLWTKKSLEEISGGKEVSFWTVVWAMGRRK